MFNNFYNEIKWFIQRGRRGYADCDVWNMHSYLSNMFPKMIRQLKNNDGCPGDLYDVSCKNDECHKWNEILEEIAQGFEAADWIGRFPVRRMFEEIDGELNYTLDFKSIKNAEQKYKKGLNLFAKYYMSLWD